MGLILATVAAVAVAVAVGSWWFSTDQVARRAMRGVPLRSIRDVAAGERVRIVGKASGDASIPAPLSGRSCFYWRVTVQELRRHGRNSRWETIIDEQEGVDFTVRDATGSALILTSHAQCVLDKDVHYSSGFLKDADPVLEQFLAQRGHSSGGVVFNKSMRYHEGVVEPGETVAVVGIGRWERDPTEPARAGGGYREGAMPMRLVLDPPDDGPLLLSDEDSAKR